MDRWKGEFRLAEKLGKHLHELIGWPGPMTHRQYQAWQDYLRAEWNEPDRHDHYLLKVCQTLVAVNSKKGAKPPELDVFKIEFAPKNGAGFPLRGLSVEERSAVGKARGRLMIVQPTRHQDQHGNFIEWLYPLGWTDKQKAEWEEKVRRHEEAKRGRK